MIIYKTEIADYNLAKKQFVGIEGEFYASENEDYFYFIDDVQHKYTSGYYYIWNDNNKIHLQSISTGAEIIFPSDFFDWNNFLKGITKSGMQAPKWFDQTDYLMANKDLFDNLVDPVEHYLNHGIKEGRDPSPFFSEQKYLELNPDIKQGVEKGHLTSGYMHYMEHGCREGRSPDGIFNEQKYLELNDDIYQGIQKGHLQCGFIHCIEHGLEEGRLGCADIYPEY